MIRFAGSSTEYVSPKEVSPTDRSAEAVGAEDGSPEAEDGSPEAEDGSPEEVSPTKEVSAAQRAPAGAAARLAAMEETERLGDEIARLAAHIHAATHRLLELIRRFDERDGWADGFRSCAEWLSWRTSIGPGAAREKVRVARALGSLPRLSAAMARGEMSYSKVRALTRVATPANEDELLEVARHATAAQIERIVRAWRRVDRLEAAEPREWAEAAEAAESTEAAEGDAAMATTAAGSDRGPHPGRELRLHVGEDGTYEIHGRLDPEVGALLDKALEWATEALYGKSPAAETSFAQRRADALGLLAERALEVGDRDARAPEAGAADAGARASGYRDAGARAAGSRDGARPFPVSRADRFQVVLHVDGRGGGGSEPAADAEGAGPAADAEAAGPAADPVAAEAAGRRPAVLADSGVGVSAETWRRLACDASVIRVARGSGARSAILDVGRKRRTVPPAIRRALEYRDGGCRFPGCGARYVDAHHIEHWADGGETALDNLVLLCRRHHRAVHEGRFRIELEGGRLRVIRSDGRVIPRVPEPIRLEPGAVDIAPADRPNADASTPLERENHSLGIAPDAWTATPLWSGERLDLGLAIDMLRG